MIEVNLSYLKKLIDALSSKTKQTCDGLGFEMMSEIIERETKQKIGGRYLSETLFQRTQKERKRDSERTRLQPHKLNVIAQFLGYKSFLDFTYQLENPMDPILRGCVGTYHSYLRRNTENAVILCSPVEIFEAEGNVNWVLKGPDQLYKGQVEFNNGCLFILMKGENGKQFHHIYEIRQRKSPNVVRGIFSGVTTAFEPIGGRVVLIRSDKTFELLTPRKFEMEELISSGSLELKKIGEYFETYAKNNLRLNKPPSLTFGIEDLDGT